MSQELLTLLRFSRRHVCDQILKLCRDRAENCNSLEALVKGLDVKEWRTFSEMKNRYLLPIHVREDVLRKCLYLWWYHTEAPHSCQVREVGDFLIKYFCLDENSTWYYQLFSNNTKVINALIYLDPVISLRVNATMTDDLLEKLLPGMTRFVKLTVNICVDNEAYQIIGRNCLKLKHLQISNLLTDFTITVERAKKLCFRDFPQNTILNSLYNTLDILDATCTPGGSEVILENIPNIGGLICNFDRIEHACLNYDFEMITMYVGNLRYDFLTTTETNVLEKLYEDFPALEYLCLAGEYEFKQLIPSSNLSKLFLQIYNSSIINVPLPLKKYKLSSKWENLGFLTISLPEENHWRMDICGLSNYCSNLKFLQVMNCTEMVGAKSKVFWKLEKLFLENVVLAKGCNILSKTCERLKFLWLDERTSEIFEDSDARKNLTSNCYPCLEFLKYLPALGLHDDFNDIFHFLEHFPKLKTFGCITDENMRRNLEDEISKRNWDLRIDYEFEEVDIRDEV